MIHGRNGELQASEQEGIHALSPPSAASDELVENESAKLAGIQDNFRKQLLLGSADDALWSSEKK
jgi:hypothetical protein